MRPLARLAPMLKGRTPEGAEFDRPVYANQFIGLHLREIADGQTYSQLSAASRANPEDEELAGQVQASFRGGRANPQ